MEVLWAYTGNAFHQRFIPHSTGCHGVPLIWVLDPCRILDSASLTCCWPKAQNSASSHCYYGIHPFYCCIPPLICHQSVSSLQGSFVWWDWKLKLFLMIYPPFVRPVTLSRSVPYPGYNCEKVFEWLISHIRSKNLQIFVLLFTILTFKHEQGEEYSEFK